MDYIIIMFLKTLIENKFFILGIILLCLGLLHVYLYINDKKLYRQRQIEEVLGDIEKSFFKQLGSNNISSKLCSAIACTIQNNMYEGLVLFNNSFEFYTISRILITKVCIYLYKYFNYLPDKTYNECIKKIDELIEQLSINYNLISTLVKEYNNKEITQQDFINQTSSLTFDKIKILSSEYDKEIIKFLYYVRISL